MLELPEEVADVYALEQPYRVAGSGYPGCRVAVLDPLDRAVHAFSTTGEYEWSTRGAGRDGVPDLTMATDISWADDSTLIVTVSPDHLIRIDARDGAISDVLVAEDASAPGLEGIDSGWQGRRRIVHSDDGVLLDHWFGALPRQVPVADIFPNDSPPLILLRDRAGRVQGTLGRSSPRPGLALPTTLNRGLPAFDRDTVWLARVADATILGFAMNSVDHSQPSRSIDLPTFFAPAAPQEWWNEEQGLASLSFTEQLRDLEFTEGGDFVVLQTRAPPVAAGDRGERVIALYAQDGELLQVFETGALFVSEMSIADGVLWMSAADTDRRLVVGVTHERWGANRCGG